jgi:DNA-directed RNA polymerase subunit delta
MGGHQVPIAGGGSGDSYDEDGYDESQRAEILEATGNGPSDGLILTDMEPDLGDDEEDEPIDELGMDSEEVGETDASVTMDEADIDEDDVQDELDDGSIDDDEDLDDADDVALKP